MRFAEMRMAKLPMLTHTLRETGDEALDFGEPATCESAENQSYGGEHARLLQPIARLLIRKTSAAVMDNVGAVG